MKALFAGFLSVSLSGSIVIGIVLVLRLFLKKAPKALLCVLWALVVLRLMFPFQIESPFGSLRPETPVFTNRDTQLFGERDLIYKNELPPFIPTQYENETFDGQQVAVDYMMLLSVVWSIFASAMLVYTLVTYLKLKHRVQESIRIEENVYVCSYLDTAFLLGYIRPKIYLPAQMDEEGAKFVIAHERAHMRRGDNWFKLIAFICLALHWFNPFVWVAYVLLCRDIENACDEAVIRNLDEQGRKNYSSAMLSCGKGKKTMAACPVAFGETSIRQRIVNVLNYRKPAIWIIVAAIVIILAVSLFFMTDPIHQEPPYYDELCASMGQPVETVCKNLGISEEDLVSIDPLFSSIYDTPIRAEYMGTEFNIQLGFNIYDGSLHSFKYIGQIQDDLDKGARSAVKISKELLSILGEPDHNPSGKGTATVADVTQEKMLELYENKRYQGLLKAAWDVSDGAAPEVIDYLYRYKESEAWIEMVGNRQPVVMFPNFWLNFTSSRDSETNTVNIILEYSVGIGTGGRYRPYEEQTWWDKVQNWLK